MTWEGDADQISRVLLLEKQIVEGRELVEQVTLEIALHYPLSKLSSDHKAALYRALLMTSNYQNLLSQINRKSSISTRKI